MLCSFPFILNILVVSTSQTNSLAELKWEFVQCVIISASTDPKPAPVQDTQLLLASMLALSYARLFVFHYFEPSNVTITIQRG